MRTLTELDERDRLILAERIEALTAHTEPIEGDYVLFADGVERRISYVWRFDDEGDDSVQTSDGGTWHLGNGYVSFSGSLYTGVARSTLTPTDETREGSCWFFHHDFAGADRGVDVTTPFRVWTCNAGAPRN